MKLAWKLAAVAGILICAAAFLAFERRDAPARSTETEAYDLSKAKELALPLLSKHGITAFAPGGTVEKEEGGLLFLGAGLDDRGKRMRVEVHFRSTVDKGQVTIWASGVRIGGNLVEK